MLQIMVLIKRKKKKTYSVREVLFPAKRHQHQHVRAKQRQVYLLVSKNAPCQRTALKFETNPVMAALCNRAGHYIFALWFLLSSIYLFSSPNLSRRRLDAYHTSTHGVALVRI